MIIIKLIGGLGNQMFQYAMGRRAALAKNTVLKMDISALNVSNLNTPREYALGAFNVAENFASRDDVSVVVKGGFFKIIDKILPYYKRSFVREPYFHFNPNMLKLRKNAYIEGYWQSEKYFKDIESIIREEFTLKNPLSGESAEIAEKISTANSVSLHIRRTDYVSDENTNKFHGVCGLDYYHAAVKITAGKIDSPHFFVFSDDIGWAKENLKSKHQIIFVSGMGELKDYEEMILMSKCKHNIIANSSFSWWGAWLHDNPEKIVVAPKRWFNDSSINTNDLIPKSWLRI